ncbi:MAG TPA: DUF924 family protein [Woeseiaceae bacterium]|nr:DUF924 family protein [Woeseiaceae bacterium]
MQNVLEFWFETLSPSDWYKKSDDLDRRIRTQFEPTLKTILAGETSDWRDSADGRLAEIIVLDQFTRNMYRGKPASFATDPLALALAQEAVRCGDDQDLDPDKRAFLYMPYMHSESPKVHEKALELFADLPNLEYEKRHKAIIDRFGRYPHRNEILGRTSTAEEIEWMATNKGF